MWIIFVFNMLLLTPVLTQDASFDRKYDYIEIDYFVNNPRLLRKYLECFLDRAPCTPVGRVFKQAIPGVITTACKKCTPVQKRLTKKAIDAFKSMLPEMYDDLVRKYDPNNKYYDKFEKAIESA